LFGATVAKNTDTIVYALAPYADREYQPDESYTLEISQNGILIREEDASGIVHLRVHLPLEYIKDIDSQYGDKSKYMQMELDYAKMEKSLFISTREYLKKLEEFKESHKRMIDTKTEQVTRLLEELKELRQYKIDNEEKIKERNAKFQLLILD
jgi:hypothetical protein